MSERRVSRDYVLRSIMQADLSGKHGREDFHDWPTRLKEGPWLEVEVDPCWLSLAGFSEQLARAYAARPGVFPPILVQYGARSAKRGGVMLYVANGNHRGRAAQLQGADSIRAFVTQEDWTRWVEHGQHAQVQVRTKDLGELGGYRVFLVNGTMIRDKINVDWVCGGNAGRYPEMTPLNEVWIDQDMNDRDIDATALHEVIETDLMLGRGWTYDRAHAEANIAETTFRRGAYNNVAHGVQAERRRLGL